MRYSLVANTSSVVVFGVIVGLTGATKLTFSLMRRIGLCDLCRIYQIRGIEMKKSIFMAVILSCLLSVGCDSDDADTASLSGDGQFCGQLDSDGGTYVHIWEINTGSDFTHCLEYSDSRNQTSKPYNFCFKRHWDPRTTGPNPNLTYKLEYLPGPCPSGLHRVDSTSSKDCKPEDNCQKYDCDFTNTSDSSQCLATLQAVGQSDIHTSFPPAGIKAIDVSDLASAPCVVKSCCIAGYPNYSESSSELSNCYSK